MKYDQNGDLKWNTDGKNGGICSPEHEAIRYFELNVFANKGIFRHRPNINKFCLKYYI